MVRASGVRCGIIREFIIEAYCRAVESKVWILLGRVWLVAVVKGVYHEQVVMVVVDSDGIEYINRYRHINKSLNKYQPLH